MNREIKFRAWDMDTQSWLYFGVEGIPEEKQNRVDYTLMHQFTGLHDKNSKDIYEGDILAPFGNITQEPQIENCFLVEYSNGSYNIGKESDTDYCVIGNIYENPELCNH